LDILIFVISGNFDDGGLLLPLIDLERMKRETAKMLLFAKLKSLKIKSEGEGGKELLGECPSTPLLVSQPIPELVPVK
jgi:hypothetical protein